MELESEQLDGGILKIALDGRMDVEGTQAVDMKLTVLTSTEKAAVLMDLEKLSFLASIGMRTLVSCAKGASARGGKLVLLNPQPMVRDVLETSGLVSLIPVFDDPDAALATLKQV